VRFSRLTKRGIDGPADCAFRLSAGKWLYTFTIEWIGARTENPNYWNMTMMKTLIATCVMALSAFGFAQNAPPPRVSPADAKNHIGETAVVCGKVVDTKIPKYGIAGHGKPVSFDLDQAEPNAIFYFVAFGTPPAGPEEVIAAYKDKRVCVTGKISRVPAGGPPFIMAADRAQIKPADSTK
jgi:hypothetical protein